MYIYIIKCIEFEIFFLIILFACMHDHDDKIFLNFIAIIKRKQNKNNKKTK